MNPLRSIRGLVLQTPLEPVARKVYAFAKGVLRRAKCYPLVQKHLSGKNGLEVGGPSDVFETNLPIYRDIQSLNNCVFAEVTHWEGARASGATFH